MQADRSMVGMFVDDSFLQPARRLVGLAVPHCVSHASLSVGAQQGRVLSPFNQQPMRQHESNKADL
jgi:hypothetical protein